MKKHFEADIRGRVQLVMFRDFAARKARSLGLCGTVQNRKDGSVRVVAEGEEAALKIFEQKLRRGPVLSRVDAVDARWSDRLENFPDFAIVY
jgi:acylphosphatase